MGRDAQFFCRTCKKVYYLGYGSATTWMDHCQSVEEFDAQADQIVGTSAQRIGDLPKNQNIRACLTDHRDHQFETHSNDWLSGVRAGVLYAQFGPMGTDKPLIEDYDQWEQVDFDKGVSRGLQHMPVQNNGRYVL